MKTSVVKSLNQGLSDLLENDPSVFVMGEDLVDPYGGAFKVTKGLSTQFPERILSTPISEAAICGLAGGMAMRGIKPIVEIMFGDFLMLGGDQLLNHISKFKWMYNNQVDVPLVIRTPMGGRRGYGPTHSQSIEKHFLGIPGLRIVALNRLNDPGKLLKECVLDDNPVIFIENKILYPQSVIDGNEAYKGEIKRVNQKFPTAIVSWTQFEPADVTLVAYGGMSELVMQAGYDLLMEDEIACEVVVPSHIKPIDMVPIQESVAKSGKLAVFEDGTENFGWGREVVYQVSQKNGDSKSHAISVGAKNIPIGNSKDLEADMFVQVEDIKEAVRELYSKSN